MKSLIRKLALAFLFKNYRRLKRIIEQRQNRAKPAEEVFTEIYRRNIWGGPRSEFYSGIGSDSGRIVLNYTAMISEKGTSENFLELRFVDLGCGDFRVGKQLLPLCSHYIGIDIVKPLINRNKEMYGSVSTQFMYLDITEDELPNGDVCFVRQVLQHLSNRQIAVVLQKLKKYKWVFITEHYPTDNCAIRPNVDQIHGSDIRASVNSGVYLTQPPFELPAQNLIEVLEVPSVDRGKGNDPGIIRTFLYKPGG